MRSALATKKRQVAPSGVVSLRLFQAWPDATKLKSVIKHGLPRPGLSREVNVWRIKNLPNLIRGYRRVLMAQLFGIQAVVGSLYLSKTTLQGRVDYGLASMRVVTTAGAAFLVDALQGTVEPEILKYHGFGTGSNAEAVGDTALHTELTTQYETDSTRPTGSLTEGASSVVFRTVGSLDPDAAVAITEHGIFSQAATGGGTLLDRSLFTAVNVAASGDSLQATYDFTITAGS